MRLIRGDWLVLALVCAWAVSARAQTAAEDRWGWSYCPPPYPPSCVKTAEAGPASVACAKELKYYIAAVAAYRACQVREVERAISEANEVSAAFRCRTEKRDCQLYKSAP
ncbi:hypothetical protein M2323_000415 [Rhodoblastus acidophilus]|uniref:hypothetical protein n=1 Tax=Rhodoblastus acidophilus TaxID=1074 RepID=UPI0022244201|nr:hypothetical protein [Rhodoblastus acidophilus]MCW2282654.1 hypothetical protein [Rhodoblastus acidophilus]MCW2331515.1 hypothetical protein [Rhodoblastus acidophilus]